MYTPNNSLIKTSGLVHFSQVESAMMTYEKCVVKKSTMEKIYSKSDVLNMVAEIRTSTGWSRDECMRHAKVKEQTGKDWYRTSKDIAPQHSNIVRIANLHQKIMREVIITDLEKARRKLDSAIDLWFKDGEIIAIRTLSAAAYEEFFKIGRERGLNFPELQSDKNIEGVIYYTIAALQSLNEILSLKEQAFYAWLARQKPALFADSARIFFSSLDLVDDDNGKEGFFNRFIRNNTDNRQ